MEEYGRNEEGVLWERNKKLMALKIIKKKEE